MRQRRRSRFRASASLNQFCECLIARSSVFEEIIECLSRAGRGRRCSGGSLLLHPHADRVELAVVTGILLGDSLRDVLRTFKPLRRIEVRTLLAGVQFEGTLGALAQRLSNSSQNRAALGAPGDRMGSWHLDGSRTEGVLACRRLLLRRRPLWLLSPAILIPVLAVFTVGQDCSWNDSFSRFNARSTSPPRCKLRERDRIVFRQNGCYHPFDDELQSFAGGFLCLNVTEVAGYCGFWQALE
jgi:hypothetical protein